MSILSVRLFVGVFAKLDQCAESRLRVKERDVESFRALAGCLVDKAATLFFRLGKCVGHAVFDGKCHVLDASATAVVGDKLGYCALFACAFKKLDLGLSDLEECCAYFLVGYFLDCKTFDTECLFVERNCFVSDGTAIPMCSM